MEIFFNIMSATKQTDLRTAENSNHRENNPSVKDHQIPHAIHMSSAMELGNVIKREERRHTQRFSVAFVEKRKQCELIIET